MILLGALAAIVGYLVLALEPGAAVALLAHAAVIAGLGIAAVAGHTNRAIVAAAVLLLIATFHDVRVDAHAISWGTSVVGAFAGAIGAAAIAWLGTRAPDPDPGEVPPRAFSELGAGVIGVPTGALLFHLVAPVGAGIVAFGAIVLLRGTVGIAVARRTPVAAAAAVILAFAVAALFLQMSAFEAARSAEVPVHRALGVATIAAPLAAFLGVALLVADLARASTWASPWIFFVTIGLFVVFAATTLAHFPVSSDVQPEGSVARVVAAIHVLTWIPVAFAFATPSRCPPSARRPAIAAARRRAPSPAGW